MKSFGIAWLCVAALLAILDVSAASAKESSKGGEALAPFIPHIAQGELFGGYADKEPRLKVEPDVESKAELGDTVSQFVMGMIESRGHKQEDAEASLNWFRIAAAKNYAPAQYNLAILLRAKTGMNQTAGGSTRLLRLAADQGFAPAQTEIARLYLYGGEGIAKNPAEGMRWLELAKGAGERRAVAAFERAAERREQEARSWANTIATPEAGWNGKALRTLRGQHTDITLTDAPCPVQTRAKWLYARMVLRPKGPLVPVARPWAACWRPDPGTPGVIDVCPFTRGKKLTSSLGICEYVRTDG